jgi:hypothetical protein
MQVRKKARETCNLIPYNLDPSRVKVRLPSDLSPRTRRKQMRRPSRSAAGVGGPNRALTVVRKPDLACVWYLDFGVGARCGSVHGSDDTTNVWAQDRPLRVFDDKNGNPSLG